MSALNRIYIQRGNKYIRAHTVTIIGTIFMKLVLHYVVVIFVVFTIQNCSNNPANELKKELKGRWVEVYKCTNKACNTVPDSIHTAVLNFNGRDFSSVLYNDSGQNVSYDTSFSGRYTISNDTLEFILDNFSELFYCRLSDNNLYLNAIYSIDSKGNKIGDFHSILWCCDKKKNGRFVEN